MCAERYSVANPSGVPQRSKRTCSEPASPSCAGPVTRPKPGGALPALHGFADIDTTNELSEFCQVVDAIIIWGDEVLAWHQWGQPSRGRLEGADSLYPSPTESRLRLHQPPQLDRPRTPPAMTTSPITALFISQIREGQQTCNYTAGRPCPQERGGSTRTMRLAGGR